MSIGAHDEKVRNIAEASKYYSSAWWSIELPAGWAAAEEAEAVSFKQVGKLGVLQVSSIRSPNGKATLQDLYDFALMSDKPVREVKQLETRKCSGLFTEYVEGKVFWKKWWLTSGPTVVYLTYNVIADLREAEALDLTRMIESVSIRD